MLFRSDVCQGSLHERQRSAIVPPAMMRESLAKSPDVLKKVGQIVTKVLVCLIPPGASDSYPFEALKKRR